VPAPAPVVGAPVPQVVAPGHSYAPAYHGNSYGSCGSCNDTWCEEKKGFFSRWRNRSWGGDCGGHGHSCNDCTGCGTYAYTDYCDTGCSGGLFGRNGGLFSGMFGGKGCDDGCGRRGLFGGLFKRSSGDCCETWSNSCDHGCNGNVIHGSPGCGVPHVNPIAPVPATAPSPTPIVPKNGGEKLPDGNKDTGIPSAQPLTIGTRSPF
jgi:hypothetical protein